MKLNWIAFGVLLAACGGCATKEMSTTPFYTGGKVVYTGRAEDRVNLWPVAYYREPVGSIAWPLISFAQDHFAIRPLYSRYPDEYNVLWPIAQFDTREHNHRIFPFFWGDDYFCLFPELWIFDEGWGLFPFGMRYNADLVMVFPLFFADCEGTTRYDTLLPLYYHSSREPDKSLFWTALGLWGYRRENGVFVNHRMLPLYYADKNSFWSIPYGHTETGKTQKDLFLGGLAGRKTSTDHDHNLSTWAFPLFYHDDHSFVSPLWGSDTDDEGRTKFAIVPPLLSWYENDGDVQKTSVLLGLAGHRAEGTDSSSWLFPLFYNDTDTFATPLFGHMGTDCDWFLPFYWRNEHAFTSLFWCHGRDAQGNSSYAFSPPLLSEWRRDSETGASSMRFLFGLGGNTTAADGSSCSWAFPLFYRDDNLLLTPLFGMTETASCLCPIYYRDDDTFASLFYWRTRAPETGWQTTWIPPLLSGLTYDEKGTCRSWSTLCGLVGGERDAAGTTLYSRALPLYYTDEETLATPLWIRHADAQTGGTDNLVPPLLSWWHRRENGQIDSWISLLGFTGAKYGASSPTNAAPLLEHWVAPLYAYAADSGFYSLPLTVTESRTRRDYTICAGLAKIYSGSRHGAHIPILFDWRKDRGYDDLLALQDCDILPPDVTFKSVSSGKTNSPPRLQSVYRGIVNPRETDNMSILVSDNNKSVSAYCPDQYIRHHSTTQDVLHVNLKGKRGNVLVLNTAWSRKATFDVRTRKKTGDVSTSSTRLFGGLFYSDERKTNALEHKTESETCVLGRLWRREEQDGNVTLDAFPGFTHDRKANGYTKTSFLWRLFRHEDDPEKGVSADLFFVPIRRP